MRSSPASGTAPGPAARAVLPSLPGNHGPEAQGSCSLCPQLLSGSVPHHFICGCRGVRTVGAGTRRQRLCMTHGEKPGAALGSWFVFLGFKSSSRAELLLGMKLGASS